MNKLFILLALVASTLLSAQNPADTSAFKVGIYAGYYMPGDATANYYSGQDNNRLRDYITNPQIRPRIEESLGNYSFSLEDFARDMAYQNAFSFEIAASIRVFPNWFISARVHNTKLTASGIFTLDVDRPNPTGPPNNIEQASISGQETRSHIDLGVGRNFPIQENLYALLEAGLDMNFVEVRENKMNIAGETYALPIYTDRFNPQATQPTTFGMGFYAASAIGYQLPSSYGFWLKLTYIQTSIDVNQVVEESTAIVIPAVGFTKSF